MCVNDLIVQGAKHYFLDYIAVGKLNLKKKKIIKGILKDAICQTAS